MTKTETRPVNEPIVLQRVSVETQSLPGLLKVAVSNQRSKVEGGLFWEIGRVLRLFGRVTQRNHSLAIMAHGVTRRKTWIQDQDEASFWHEGHTGVVSVPDGMSDVVHMPRAGMPPSRKICKIAVGGSTLGEMGEISPCA